MKISDIKALGALGDSLSAGTAAEAQSVYNLLTDYRDVSFSAGGGESLETLVTIPNILKKYNKNLVGCSTGINAFYKKTSGHFNLATGANRADHIPDQARELVERMVNSTDFDYKNDWKLITLFIGGNDLCEYCFDKKSRSPKSFINYIKEALNILYNQLPKTFVNIILPAKVHKIGDYNLSRFCRGYHYLACRCASYPADEDEEQELIKTHEQYVNYTYNLVNSNRYERVDFTVVIQPFLQKMELPRTESGDIDLKYFAPDCLHLSRKGQQQLAISLWNSMLTGVEKKKTNWDLSSKIKCPTLEKPFLCTRKNDC